MLSYDQILTPVFNIQSFCIHDGPGIRTTIFLKGCPLRCIWCQNPESMEQSPQLLFYETLCTGCLRCVDTCPTNAIRLVENGSLRISTDRNLCNACGHCAKLCPNNAREQSGLKLSVQAAFQSVEEDKLFLKESGGGMTISGGEALMHPDFTENLLQLAKHHGIHTAVETCGFASRNTVDRVFQHVDLALYDIKHMDSTAHQRLTGVPNEPILDNLIYIRRELGIPVIVRIPVVPGYNASKENIAAVADFVRNKLDSDVPIELLPYHRLGESKRASLGMEQNLSIESPSLEELDRYVSIIAARGLRARING